MTNQGDFATHHRDGDDVIKMLDEQHTAGVRFVATVENVGMTGMTTYLAALRAAGVTLPPQLSVESVRPLVVRHRWVPGPVLLDHASTDPSRFIDAVIEIARWVRALDATDARMDTNLANFCLAGDHLVLVDVLPPLIPSLRPVPSNGFDVLFNALCFDTEVILDALIGYGCRALLHPGINVAHRCDDLVRQLPQDVAEPATAMFPASWFRARVTLALGALAGKIQPEKVHDFFALTSVRTFRDLSGEKQNDRARQVDLAIKELALR